MFTAGAGVFTTGAGAGMESVLDAVVTAALTEGTETDFGGVESTVGAWTGGVGTGVGAGVATITGAGVATGLGVTTGAGWATT